MQGTKVLMTCREVVFKKKEISISVLSNKANVIFLTGEEHRLNVHDKHKLLSIYKLETNMMTTNDLASSSTCFHFFANCSQQKTVLKFMDLLFLLHRSPSF